MGKVDKVEHSIDQRQPHGEQGVDAAGKNAIQNGLEEEVHKLKMTNVKVQMSKLKAKIQNPYKKLGSEGKYPSEPICGIKTSWPYFL
jgi:hypothetical protein